MPRITVHFQRHRECVGTTAGRPTSTFRFQNCQGAGSLIDKMYGERAQMVLEPYSRIGRCSGKTWGRGEFHPAFIVAVRADGGSNRTANPTKIFPFGPASGKQDALPGPCSFSPRRGPNVETDVSRSGMDGRQMTSRIHVSAHPGLSRSISGRSVSCIPQGRTRPNRPGSSPVVLVFSAPYT